MSLPLNIERQNQTETFNQPLHNKVKMIQKRTNSSINKLFCSSLLLISIITNFKKWKNSALTISNKISESSIQN